MPREIVTIQAGQCGNQIGLAFWDLLLAEHAKIAKQPVFDDALSSFFRNVDAAGRDVSARGVGPIQQLKARCVIVDTEEGVINQLMRSELRELFDAKQVVKDVSGAGNNWAHGFAEYGPRYRAEILDKIRREVEACSSPQSFFLLHSLGGGTGSGLGTYVLAQLADEFPGIFRFTASVYPSREDDVITSPYNALFANQQLAEHADCVFPVDNDSLLALCHPRRGPPRAEGVEERGRVFGRMNSVVAHLLSNITCSMRYEGKLNVDLNEITMNLVPFPQLHFLLASMAPLQLLLNRSEPRGVDAMFRELLLPESQLMSCRPKLHKYLAIGLLLRGQLSLSDVARNVERLKAEAGMVWWNPDGFKYGICDAPPVYHSSSVLCLANNTGVAEVFAALTERFQRLYRRKVYVHHYTGYVPEEAFDDALAGAQALAERYAELGREAPRGEPPRFHHLIV